MEDHLEYIGTHAILYFLGWDVLLLNVNGQVSGWNPPLQLVPVGWLASSLIYLMNIPGAGEICIFHVLVVSLVLWLLYPPLNHQILVLKVVSTMSLVSSHGVVLNSETGGRGSSSHVKLNFKKYRLFVRLKFYHLKNIEQTDVDKSKRR